MSDGNRPASLSAHKGEKMTSVSLRSIRGAMLCASLALLLSPFSSAAQQTTSANPMEEKPVNAVPGLRAASGLTASQRSAANPDPEQDPFPPQALVKENRGAPASFGQFFKNIARDQAGMWTSPLRIRRHDLVWLIPFAGATAAAIDRPRPDPGRDRRPAFRYSKDDCWIERRGAFQVWPCVQRR